MSATRIYNPADRPPVAVHTDGRWVPGELRAWFPHDDHAPKHVRVRSHG